MKRGVGNHFLDRGQHELHSEATVGLGHIARLCERLFGDLNAAANEDCTGRCGTGDGGGVCLTGFYTIFWAVLESQSSCLSFLSIWAYRNVLYISNSNPRKVKTGC